MRLLHTADWHLGRSFHNVSLIEDQAHVLRQLVDLARDAEVDAVIVAGDVYDRAVPPPDAVRLLSDTLGELTLGLNIPVIMIAGNHDSAERLNFGSKLLAQARCHIFGRLGESPEQVVLEDQHGPVHVLGLPYAEPSVVRERTGQADVHPHDAAMTHLAAAAAARVPEAERSILVAHCFVAGGAESESERPLSVGGAGSVSAAAFAPFDYVALGHLHRPQPAGPNARYPGSLLKYSFSEIGHEKSVSLVELDAAGTATVEAVPLVPRRDMRMIEGAFKDLLAGPARGESADDYLLVRLTDTRAILDPMGQLRAVYPNVLHLERPALERAAAAPEYRPKEGQGDPELFAAFFEQVTGEAISDEQAKAFAQVLEDLRRAEREAGA